MALDLADDLLREAALMNDVTFGAEDKDWFKEAQTHSAELKAANDRNVALVAEIKQL